MIIPHELYTKIGGFDERFFLYGEDLDLCWRIREEGFEVWYYPETQIIHRKGKSSSKHLIRSRIAFYEAMVLFSEKYRHIHRSFFPNQLIFLGIILQAVFNISANLIKYFTPAIIDLGIINFVLWGGLTLRFHIRSNPYNSGHPFIMLGLHGLLSFCFIFMFAYNGIYSKKRYSISNTLLSGVLASVLFMALIYFINSLAVSRIVFGFSTVVISILLVGWRELIPKTIRRFKQFMFAPVKIVIMGSGVIPSHLIKSIEEQKNGNIIGIVWCDTKNVPGEYEGYPVLGSSDYLSQIIGRSRIDMLLIATPSPWYSQIIEVLSTSKIKHMTIRWVPHNLFDKPHTELPPEIPLLDFSV